MKTVKTVNSSRPPIFWSTPIFCDFLAWQAGTTRTGQYRKQSAHIDWPAVCIRHLHEEETTSSVGEHQRVERCQSLWTLPGQNRKEMLHYFVHVYICQHLYFVDAYIFVVAYILVGAYIMSAPIFRGRLDFVNAYILSMSIFFRHLYLS